MDKKRILIVDDEVKWTEALKGALEHTGAYEVRTANTGEAGVVIAKEWKPRLILLDVMMPDMDGGDVIAALKTEFPNRMPALVLVTGAITKDETQSLGGEIGNMPCLAKPVELRDVIACVERYCQPDAV